MTDPTRLTLSQLGLALGISKQAVSKAAGKGMPLDSVEAAQAWRLKNLDVGRTKAARVDVSTQSPLVDAPVTARAGLASRAGGASSASPASDAPAGDLDGVEPTDTDEYRRHRTDRERIRKEREQIELDTLRGSLIDVEDAKRIAYTAFRAMRDAVLNIPARVQDQLAAETDAFKVGQVLEEELTKALGDFSAAVLTGEAEEDDGDETD